MRSLRRITGIREGEGVRALMMFSYIFLVITSLQILKPVRNSLFLTRFGFSQLPYVYLLVGVVVGIAIFFYSRAARKLKLGRLVSYSLIVSIAVLLLFRTMLIGDHRSGFLAYAFYIWVEMYGVILTAQFWLLTNFVFNSREAKRLFGFVGAGAICGGIAGGYLTKWLVPHTGTVNLILICCAALMVCLGILRVVWQKSVKHSLRERRFVPVRLETRTGRHPIRAVLESPHLRLIAGIVGIGVLIGNLVDYQFNVIASTQIQNRDQLTAFFGFWLSNLSVISLLIQLFITPRILMKLGVGTSLFVLPAGIMAATAYFLVSPGVYSGLSTKVADGGLKHSVNKVGLELLYLPVPSDIKTQVKTFIDVFVDSFAEGLSGILLIVLGLTLGTQIRSISLVVGILVLLWFAMVFFSRRTYVNAFRTAIEQRTIDLEEQKINLEDASLFDFIARILEGDKERRILLILNLIENSRNAKLIPYLRNLLNHPSDDIKIQVLQMLSNFDYADFTKEIEPLVHDNSFEVRTGAIHYLARTSRNREQVLESLFTNSSADVRTAVLMVAAHYYSQEKDFRKRFPLVEHLNSLIKDPEQDKGNDFKIQIARIIGQAREPALYPYLHELLHSPEREILREAIRAGGDTDAPEFVPILIQHLNTRRVRKYARLALACYGEDIINSLVERLDDPKENRIIRLSIPKVLALIGSQRSIEILMSKLEEPDLLLRYEVIKGLSKLKANFPNLKINREIITKEILEETKYYFKTLTVLKSEQSNGEQDEAGSLVKARKLLIRALEERLDNNLERIFRLLGLRYSTEDMFSAYKGIVSDQSDLRANAVEFLDNILDRYLRRYILPIVEELHQGEALESIREEFGLEEPTQKKTLEDLLLGDDSWLRICALYVVSALDDKGCAPLVARLKDDLDPIVRETAVFALEHLEAVPG
ncbi:HEAT repeat domain-containing protein [bacterium]|nr:HEAT repeat domain-containing protein [bacterium]